MEKELESVGEILLQYWNDLIEIGPKLLVTIVLFFLFFMVAWLLRMGINKLLSARIDDKLLSNFIARGIFWLFVVIGFSLSLKIIGWEKMAGGVIASAGIGAIIIGFAFKDIGENFLSGIFMAFSRPFKVGDKIDSNGVQGEVLALNLRNTHIKTADGKDTYIPNSAIIKNVLHNHTIDGFMRYHFDVGIDYAADPKKAMELIEEVIENTPGVLNNRKKEPSVTLLELGANALLVRVYFWIDTFDEKTSLSAIRTSSMINILKAMEIADIHLPGTVIELRNYKDEAIKTV